jgi:dihydropyrimidine dehydrogenase (NAD+) subunit PreT
MKGDYMKENKISYLIANEEASRCLLCYDAPCSKACPANSNPAKFIQSIRFKNFKGASINLEDNNILSEICGKLCPADKYCEKVCIRAKIDRPIKIKMLHEYLSDIEASNSYNNECGNKEVLGIEEDKINNIAILGSSSSALTAAGELGKMDYKVTIFDTNDFGGDLIDYVANKILNIEVIEKKIKFLKKLKVNFEINPNNTNSEICETLTMKKYDALIISDNKFEEIISTLEKRNIEIFYTGNLVNGPNDVTFSVKKGKDVANKVSQYLMNSVKNLEVKEGSEI